MAMQFSVAARNAALDALETAIGASPTLEIRTGAAPANVTDADTGTVLATLALPADWMAAAAAGSKAKAGTWQDLAADATGTAGHFRLKAGATTHIQGGIVMSPAPGDMVLDNTSLAVGQQFTVNSFTLTA